MSTGDGSTTTACDSWGDAFLELRSSVPTRFM